MAKSRTFDIIFRTKGTDKAQRDVGDIDNRISDLSVTAKQTATILSTALAAGTVAVGTKAVKTAGQFEMLRARLQGLTGSQKEANRLFDEFNQIAARTPFSVQEVIDAGATLQAFGLDAENLLTGIADLAAFMQVDIATAAQNFGRAMNAGAGAADMFRDKGINQLVASFAGVDNVTKLTLPEFQTALQKFIVDPSQPVAGATALMAETLVGKFSNAGDAVDRLAGRMGDELLPTVKAATDIFIEFTDNIKPEDIFSYTKALSLVTAGLGAYTLAQNAANISAAAFSKALPVVIFTTIVAGLSKVVKEVEKIQRIADNTTKSVNSLFVGDSSAFGEANAILNENIDLSKLSNAELLKLNESFAKFAVDVSQVSETQEFFAEAAQKVNEELKTRIDINENLILSSEQYLKSVKAVIVNGSTEKAYIDSLKGSYGEFINQQMISLENKEKEQKFIDRFVASYPEQAEALSLVSSEQLKHQKAVDATVESFANIGSAASSTSQLLASLANENKQMQLVALQIAKIAAIANIAQGVTKAFAQGGILGFATGASITAAGAAQIATIDAQISALKKAQFGMDEMVSQPTLILAGEAGPERVQVTPATRPSVNENQGGMTINFLGPITDRDFVRDTIIPEIEKTQRLGLA